MSVSLHSFVVSFKKYLRSLTLYIFSWFNTCIWGRGRQPPADKILMSKKKAFSVYPHLLQVSKKSPWSLILYNLLHDLIHVYSLRAGGIQPQGTKFSSQQRPTYPISSLMSLRLRWAKNELVQLIKMDESTGQKKRFIIQVLNPSKSKILD